MELWTSLDTSHQITIVLAVIGWGVAIWKSYVAHQHKKDSVIFENRLEIYNKYFQKLDDINERLMIDFQEFMGPTIQNFYVQILEDPENSNQALIELQQSLSEVQLKASKTISQAEQELQKLRFIATEETLEILDRYKNLANLQLKKMEDVLGSIDIQEFQNFDADENQELVEIGNELIATKNNLESQMREDLGIK